MCHKIQCDEKSWKILDFGWDLNRASLIWGANKGGGLGSSDISKGVSHHSDVFEAEDMMDSQSMLSKDSDLEKETAGWQLSKSKKKRKGTRKQVMVATRTSSRVPRDRISIATKAANRIKALNDNAGESSSLVLVN